MSLFMWTFVVGIPLTWFMLRECNWTIELVAAGGKKFRHSVTIGLSHDMVYDEGGLEERSDPYLERWILWIPWFDHVHSGDTGVLKKCWIFSSRTIRLHKFHRGDDDSAPHDHPWWYLTFPLKSYQEVWWDSAHRHLRTRVVKAFRFHFKPALHRHYVVLPPGQTVWTFVVTGGWCRRWGFWPKQHEFVYWRDWIARKKGQAEAARIALARGRVDE